MSQELHTVGAAVSGGGVTSPSANRAAHRERPVAEGSEQAVSTGQVSLSQKREALEAAVEEANRALAETSLSVSFSVDGNTNQVVARLTNESTGEVVRQIPSEDQIAIAARLRELVGVLFNGAA